MRPADFAENLEKTSNCSLCPNFCHVVEGKRGRCLGRGRQNGVMTLFNYGIVTSAHLDPIEKKPLYHFFPGRPILSLGSYGCNLNCRFCQNCDISQNIVEGDFLAPEEILEKASAIEGNIGVAFTYNEPGIWYEYIMDCAPALRKRGLKIVLVTNGYLEKKPWENLCSVADAMNIDLKAFTNDFYRRICGGKLAPVKDNIAMAAEKNVHVELTNLVVTGLNTEIDDFRAMVDWVAGISPAIPFHISRYFPRFHETAPATDPALLEQMFRIASEKLSYVYVGNCSLPDGSDTLCPKCGQTWIKRRGYLIFPQIASSTCSCGHSIPISGLVEPVR